MALSEHKKKQINQAIYSEVINKLEQYFNDLSITFMPINGTYFYYTNGFENVVTSKLFTQIEIIIKSKDYVKITEYLDKCISISKIVATGYKSAYSFKIGGINVIRVDIYKSIPFPGDYVLYFELLLSRGIKTDTPNLILPSPEDVLLLIICKSFHFINQFFDYSVFYVIKPVIFSENFSWDKLWSIVNKYRIKRFTSFFLALYTKHTTDNTPPQKIFFYSQLLSLGAVQFFYKVSPGILKKIFFKVSLADNPVRYLYKHTLDNVKRFVKKNWDIGYKAIISKIARKYLIENENTIFNAIMVSVNRSLSQYQLDYSLNEDFIIGTSSGLWYLKKDKLYQIAYASSYGITSDGERWYANQNIGQFSRIISFTIDNVAAKPEIIAPNHFAQGLPKNVHQIDFYDNLIYVVDTLNNRIISIDRSGKRTNYFPNRKIKTARNNNHFNSIFITEKFIYLCAHNGTLKPKTYSKIYVLNKSNMKKHEIIQTNAGNAHNIIPKDGEILYCDSMAGELICEKNIVFKDSKYLMRGLAITDNHILAGGSQFARREERAATDGAVFVLDKNYNHITTIELKSIGQVYEIRGVNNDCGLSAKKINSPKDI